MAGTLALASLLLLAIKGVRVAEAARQAQHDAQTVLTALRSAPDAPPMRGPSSLDALARSLRALQAELGPLAPALRLARWLPAEAGWVADVPDALAVTVPLAELAAAAGATDGHHSVWAQARDLEALGPAVARLEGRPLGGPLHALEPVLHEVAALTPVLQVLGLALDTAAPRTYVLLGQNSDELRATGGFVGTAGWVTVTRGRLLEFEYGSSYEIDAGVAVPPAPPPLVRHLGLGGWYLRDANWWPDFPATAAQVEAAWLRAGYPPLDGVIGFDDTALDRLLRLVGPVEVPGYGMVDADRFVRLAVEHLYSPSAISAAGDFHRNTTAFFGPFSRALLERLRALPPSALFPLARTLVALLDEKHIQLAFKDPRLATLVHAHGWAGALPVVDGDSLLVVDTTVSYGKTFLFVDTESVLEVELTPDGQAVHDLALRYRNVYPRGLQAWMPTALVGGDHFDVVTGRLRTAPGFWGNWLRVYLPLTARLLRLEGLAEVPPPGEEFGRLVVAGYLSLPPGETREVRLRYVTDLGRGAAPERYRLYLQKQAGLHCRRLTLVVRWPVGDPVRYEACPTVEGWLELTTAAGTPAPAVSPRS